MQTRQQTCCNHEVHKIQNVLRMLFTQQVGHAQAIQAMHMWRCMQRTVYLDGPEQHEAPQLCSIDAQCRDGRT